jgi:DNA-binding response OmpR family regulator
MKILLLDGDKDFARKLRDRLRPRGIELDWRRSLFELGSVGRLGNYDLLLVEPHLGPVSGLEIAEYADAFFPGLPVLLVGDRKAPASWSQWPRSAVGYVPKSAGIEEVVSEIEKHGVLHAPQTRFRAPTPRGSYLSA